MANTIKIDIVSAEKSIYSGTAKLVVVPGASGELGILHGHAPLVSQIRPGLIKVIHENDEEELVFVAGGVVEVQPEQIIVLADVADRLDELDAEKAEKSRRKAAENLERLKSQHKSPEAIAVVEAELALMAAQLKAIQKYKKDSKRH